MTADMRLYARLSLGLLWIVTAVTSISYGSDLGYEVLAKGGITGSLADLSIYSGSALDLVLGVWVLTNWNLKVCYQIQIMVVVIYSLLLTIIDFSFWFHPFGPLTKNVPIVALICILYIDDSKLSHH